MRLSWAVVSTDAELAEAAEGLQLGNITLPGTSELPLPDPVNFHPSTTAMYRRTSISGTKKAQIIFPLRHFFPLKVVKQHGKVKSNSMENCPA
jgi:hypothetical protein